VCGRARPCKRRRRRACRRESRKVRHTRSIASRETRHACTGLDEVLSIHSFTRPSWMARAVNGRGWVRDGRVVVK